MKTILAEIKNRLEKATPGPWHWVRTMFGWKALDATGRKDVQTNEQLHVLYVRNDGLAGMTNADANLIEHAPTDIAKLLRAVELQERIIQATVHTLNGASVCNNCSTCKVNALEMLSAIKLSRANVAKLFEEGE